jgi:hypothetical protein
LNAGEWVKLVCDILFTTRKSENHWSIDFFITRFIVSSVGINLIEIFLIYHILSLRGFLRTNILWIRFLKKLILSLVWANRKERDFAIVIENNAITTPPLVSRESQINSLSSHNEIENHLKIYLFLLYSFETCFTLNYYLKNDLKFCPLFVSLYFMCFCILITSHYYNS